jgi:transcriptional regulator with XRE-family HTH domain
MGKAEPLTNRLQALREARGLTLRDLAALVGTSNQQLNKLELGKRQLTTAWLSRLAAALRCHPWEIVEGASPGLSDREQILLTNFRRLSDEQQHSLLAEMTARASLSGVGNRRAG